MFVMITLILFLTTFNFHYAWSNWEYAVTTKNEITFFDKSWSIVTTAAHQFHDLSAIAFDESNEIIYFNDKSNYDGSIFRLKLSAPIEANHFTNKIVSKILNETVENIAIDLLDDMIYWTDSTNRRIYRMPSVEKSGEPNIFLEFKNDTVIPEGLAVDICRRKIYWTNSNHRNPTIERCSLDGTQRELIISSDLYHPHGITIDQKLKRLYWVVNQKGSHFTIESADLDGSDRKVLAGLNSVPFSLAVTDNAIYYTDLTHNSIWNISKSSLSIAQPFKVKSFDTKPRGIVARTYFLSEKKINTDCLNVMNQIKIRLQESGSGKTNSSSYEIATKDTFCLNDGGHITTSGVCICKIGYTGLRCEQSDCFNYCVHGTCEMNPTGFRTCICQQGFYGVRCESNVCTGYCLNEGSCSVINGSPNCDCHDIFFGNRCEYNKTEMCPLVCVSKEREAFSHIFSSCSDSCRCNSSDHKFNISKEGMLQPATVLTCQNHYNKTVIFITVGIVIGLFFIFLIIQSLRKIYKPARPKIKKTFVVKKKMSHTPLTSRPIESEECEITIENCCNMNICDTPCFDPKILQQSNMKDDKKILVQNMEDDLY